MFIAVLMVFVAATVHAAERIYVDAVSAQPGSQTTITVNCDFTCENITLYQFDLYLPEGVTLAKNNKGRFAAGTTYVLGDRHDEHAASIRENEGYYRFVVVNNDGYTIAPGTGPLLTLTFDVDASVSGTQRGYIRQFLMFETDETEHKFADIAFELEAPGALVMATDISVSPASLTLTDTTPVQLDTEVLPANASNKNVTWTTSNENVVAVSATGKVTAVANGTAVVKATTQDGTNLSASCQVTVNLPVPAQSITLDQNSLSFTEAGQTAQLKATVRPNNATDKSVMWESTNKGVATVNANGLVTAVGSGTCVIIATTQDGTNLTASCAVTVSIDYTIYATGISLDVYDMTLTQKGETRQITATVQPSNATTKSVTWTSNDRNVATVDSRGMVTAVANGTASITATTQDGTNLTAQCVVTVNVPTVIPETDLTTYVGTTAADWNTNSIVAEQYGPGVTTRDGRQTALVERYQQPADVTGIVLEQTVTGLPEGVYKTVLYANAYYTPGRGFDSAITDGQTDVVYLFANNSHEYIPVHIGTTVSQHGEYELTCNVTDGTLHLGMVAEKPGTNWHSIQIKSLDRIGDIEPVQTDYTSSVGVSAEDWNTNAMVGWAAPAVTTNDGRETALAERYQEPADVTGVVLEQTVTGLPAGAYRTVLFANAYYTPGRGFDSDITDGQTDVVYLFANDTRQYIPVHIGTSVTQHGEYTLISDVTDGTLHLGMVAEKAGTNWHSIQIKLLERIGNIGSGIEETPMLGKGQSAPSVYDLSGRKIENRKVENRQLRKGLYIIDGRKVIIR